MPSNPSSTHSTHAGFPIVDTPSAGGPVPLPSESPFLSDHGLGTPAPPPGPRSPAVTPSEFSQFPASAPPPPPPPPAPPAASARATDAIPRGTFAMQGSGSSPISAPPETLSSFPFFRPDGGEESYPPLRGSQAAPRPAPVGNELLERLKSILVTTTDSLQGRLVESYLGLVTAEALIPSDVILDGAEKVGHFSRFKTSQTKLKALQQLVVAELKLEADKLGGNAVLGADLRVTMDRGLVTVIATGTAARIG